MHWRFTALRGVRWGIEDFSVSGEPWALILHKGQAYKQRYWQGSTQLAQDITNWIIFENILPTSSRKLPEPVLKNSSQSGKNNSKNHSVSKIKRRLYLLEQLRKDNAITEKEYEDKRRKILNQF